VKITFDSDKRNITLTQREVDFLDANVVIEHSTIIFEDIRKDYKEKRYSCYGYLRGRLMFVGFTIRDDATHVFSMRKANAREQKKYKH
jgi:uncharacterized protein